MCGIFGQLELRPNASGREGLLARASGHLRHRGPDGVGSFVDAHCAFGHTRLKVIDPSQAAMQPMRSASGRSVVTYNGELFNYLELRAQLDVPMGGFRSTSDTEVLLEALEQRGLDAVRSFNGMFAVAWWRAEERELVLIRDRLGKKPLYWMRLPGGALRFASEISALFCDGTQPRTSTDRIAEFLQYGYNLAPRTSFSGVESVPPGHFLRAKLRDDRIEIAIERYWTLPPYQPSEARDFRTWVDELDATLSNAVKIRLRADVPLGIFLSGGIDSSVVALLASRELGSGLRTMTVDFAEKEFSEAAYAQEVAESIEADHRRVEAGAPTVDDVAGIVATYGELHGDVSALASVAASRATRDVATVALTGDGADEVLGGYSRYSLVLAATERAKKLPQTFVRAAAATAERIPPWLGGDGTLALYHDDIARSYLATVRQFPAHSTPPLFRVPVEPWTDPLVDALIRHRDRPPLIRLMAVDADTYIPGDTLPNLDRASMSVALELRHPFLDYRLFELVARARPEWIIEGDRGKQPLRYLYASALPPSVFTRPKLGFAVPTLPWFRRPEFSKVIERVLDDSARIYEVLDPVAVRTMLRGFGWRLNRAAGRVWHLLVLEEWLQRWRPTIDR